MSETDKATPISVRVVEDSRDFDGLAQTWQELQQRARLTSVFETYEWQRVWWDSYGKTRHLRILVATAGGETVGILPLHIDTVKMLRWPVRTLRFVGNGGDTAPDDLGPILAPGQEGRVAEALGRAALQVEGWDVLHLPDMNPACAFTTTIAKAANVAQLETLEGRSERIAYMPLPTTWESFLESLSNHRRKRIRYLRKRFASTHAARFFVCQDEARLDEVFERLVHLHHTRWKEQSSAFTSPEYLGFHRGVIKACMPHDRIRLYCLELGGQIMAVQYCYRFRNAVYVMQTGYDPAYSDAGQVLLGYMVESAISEGNAILDFLRGEHAYKEQYPSSERETVFVTALRDSPGGWAYRARLMYLPGLKRHIARIGRKLGLLKTSADPG